jgi:hypothetical protein
MFFGDLLKKLLLYQLQAYSSKDNERLKTMPHFTRSYAIDANKNKQSRHKHADRWCDDE